MDLSLILAALAFVGAGFALWRAHVPPQRAQVRELIERVIDCEEGYQNLAARLTRRAKGENMAKAREVHEGRASELRSLEEQAQHVLALNSPAAPKPPAAPQNPEELRAALRAQLRSQPSRRTH